MFEAKPVLKEALQAEVGLPVRSEVPLIGFIGRLEEQKGSDILAEALNDFLKEDIQLIVLVRLSLFSPILNSVPSLYTSTDWTCLFFFSFGYMRNINFVNPFINFLYCVPLLLGGGSMTLIHTSLFFLWQGTGKKHLEKQLEEFETKFPGKAVGIVKFNTPLAHMITAGADYILVPSRFEPCGLIQLHAMRYGTVCVLS